MNFELKSLGLKLSKKVANVIICCSYRTLMRARGLEAIGRKVMSVNGYDFRKFMLANVIIRHQTSTNRRKSHRHRLSSSL